VHARRGLSEFNSFSLIFSNQLVTAAHPNPVRSKNSLIFRCLARIEYRARRNRESQSRPRIALAAQEILPSQDASTRPSCG
jgi:hypothetical protein